MTYRAKRPRHRRSARRRRLLGLVAVLVAAACGATAPPRALAQSERGWTYLIDKLAADGVNRRRAATVFSDPRVEPFTKLEFSLWPRESNSLYKSLRSASSIAGARKCRARFAPEFAAAQEKYGVPASVVAAIIQVESQCGRFTGNNVVLYRVARLAMANEPANVRRNIARHSIGEPHHRLDEIDRRTRERARYLEDTFYPEVLSTFRIADRLGIDPLGIRGSGAGAFGLPQFLPSSYLRFGVDGNGDGRVSLYDPADAIPSCANYLKGHGWRPGLSRSQQRDVLWGYNRSAAYIDTILLLSDRMAPGN